MINTSCKNCSKFKTNDCSGLENLTTETCKSFLKEKSKEVDVSGCC